MQPSEFFAAGKVIACPLLNCSILSLVGERCFFYRFTVSLEGVISEILINYSKRFEQIMLSLKSLPLPLINPVNLIYPKGVVYASVFVCFPD
jgi:hypothetical protein